MTTPLLEMRGISKTFPGTRALRDVALSVYAGEVHALMGENGAGKSTLMKILGGAYRPDAGAEIRIDGKPVKIDGPQAARAHGIAIIYQELALAPNLTVAENIYLGCELAHAGVIDRAAMNRGCVAVLQRLGASFEPQTVVGTLSIAEQQLVEIARAIHTRSRILVMDEPSTTLSSRETDRLFDLIRELRASGLAIIYISHRMAEVYELADRVSVLRDGAYAGELTREHINPEALVRMMVGRDLSSFYKKEHGATVGSMPLLEVRTVSDKGRVRNCSLTVHAGEVLALAGMVGAGRTELARLVYGADQRNSGEILLEGKPLRIKKPADAILAGLVYLTEDRKSDGLFLDMAVADNINVGVIARDARYGGVLNRARGRQRVSDAVAALAIRIASPAVEVGSLSGGNQQKVLLSRLLETQPKVLILDEPTRGVDIGAKSEIYRIIDDLAKRGVGILVISSELPEIVGIADRVLVMREGEIVGELAGNDITQENIVSFATAAHTLGVKEAIA
jgi:ribose transport system ATP-binding protein